LVIAFASSAVTSEQSLLSRSATRMIWQIASGGRVWAIAGTSGLAMG